MLKHAYETEAEVIPKLLREVYTEVVLKHLDNPQLEIYNKGNNDLVTDCDYQTEEFIKRKINSVFPGDGFIAEELSYEYKKADRLWILDPIDGTVNFSSGIKLFGIQIALLEFGLPVFSAIYLPCQDELYIAVKDQGAYLNGKPIKVSSDAELKSSLITFGDFSTSHDRIRETQINTFNKLYKKVRKIKMFGASSVDFAYLASGRTQGHIMFTNNLWDIIPGYFLAIEAGAFSNYRILQPSPFILCAANDRILSDIHNTIGDLKGII